MLHDRPPYRLYAWQCRRSPRGSIGCVQRLVQRKINAAIRAGQPGEARFYAIEAGRTIGTPFMSEHTAWRGVAWRGEGLASRHFCVGCAGQCVGTDQPCIWTQEIEDGRPAPAAP